VILKKQVDKLKTEKLGELKAQGVEYEQRMEELDKIEHPKPNAEFLYGSFAAFAQDHPWVSRENIRPKSVAREIVENFLSFSGYIKEYGLARSEGSLLRYLSEVYKTLVQTVPERARTEELDDLILHFGALVRGVDASLLDEWERLRNPEYVAAELPEEPRIEDITTNTKRFTVLVRNLIFSFLRALDARDFESALDLVEGEAVAQTPNDLERALKPLFEQTPRIQLDARARSPHNLQIQPRDGAWDFTQNILIEDEVSEFTLRGHVDLRRSAEERRAVVVITHVGAE
jgi:hypothetical protein